MMLSRIFARIQRVDSRIMPVIKFQCMKFLLYSLAVIALMTFTTVGQDADPVMKGSAKYTMPQSAIDAEIDGPVVVAVHVDETGKVKSAKLFTGPMWPCGSTPTKAFDELASTLETTMKSVEFTPATKNGKAVDKVIGVTITLKNPKIEPAPEIDPATGRPKAKLVQGGVLNGKAILLPKPAYPAAARFKGDGGAVSVQVMIDEKGNVIRARPMSGAPTLQIASRDAACAAKFSPLLLAGNPIKVSGVITYNFVP